MEALNITTKVMQTEAQSSTLIIHLATMDNAEGMNCSIGVCY